MSSCKWELITYPITPKIIFLNILQYTYQLMTFVIIERLKQFTCSRRNILMPFADIDHVNTVTTIIYEFHEKKLSAIQQ